MATSDPTVFPCGRGFLPGTQGPGVQGNEPTVTPVVLTPVPPDDPIPPFDPSSPPPATAVKCVEISPGQGAPPADPGFVYVNPPYRQCMPCDGGQNTIVDPNTGLRIGPENNPDPGSEGCVYVSIDECKPNCLNPQERIPVPGDVVPRQTTTGPTTGGTISGFRCQEYRFVCLDDLELPINEQRVRNLTRTCVPMNPNDPNAVAGVIASGVAGNEAFLVIFGDTLFATEQECQENCVPVAESFSVVCDGQVSTGEPTGDPIAQSVEILSKQEATNANVVTVTPIVEQEDWKDTQRGFTQPSLFDPKLNFVTVETNELISRTPMNSYSNIFKSEVASEVAYAVDKINTNESWNEVILQNLTDNKLAESLNPNLLRAFQSLRYPGGKPVGMSTLLNVVRKHILEGTLDELDTQYFVDVAEGQLSQNFDILVKPEQPENADRLALDYLKNNLHTYANNKVSTWRNNQINRVRPLNADVNHEVNVTTLDGTVKELKVPNDGFAIDKITALDQVTLPALGSPDKLNIGDGGGYYIHATNTDLEGVAVYTKNEIPRSYYAPPALRMKVLDMLDVDPAITITASSLSEQHEFVSGDTGASAVKPLFFILDLSSTSGESTRDSLIESYSGTYVRIDASGDIQKHLNNNALNTPMLSIDYRDPIYRYILDTSSFVASLNDFNLVGFNDKGLSSIGSRFVRNIPFGFVVTPVAGGKYNPFNGRSTLDRTGSVHVRSLAVLPATDSSIDTNPTSLFRAYSLNKVDGVDRVGVGEAEDNQNIGYQYVEEDFTNTFFSGGYGTSSSPSAAQGVAYMLTEVIDHLSSTYSATTLTWFDVFSRVPSKRLGEMFYDSSRDFIRSIANGFRGGIKIENIEAGYEPESRLIPEDSKTIVTVGDRRNVTRTRI